MILADTDVLIEYLAERESASSAIEDILTRGNLSTTSISCFELFAEAGEGKRGDMVRQVVAVLPVVDFDQSGAAAAAAGFRRLQFTGMTIGMADSLIAGIAISQGMQLLTRNRKHFEPSTWAQIGGSGLRITPVTN